MAPMLTSFSPEILHAVCLNVEPQDLASLAGTCQFLHGFIQRDDLLWKLHYLSRFNEPSNQDSRVESWKTRLQNIVSVQKILESDNQDLKNESGSLERVCHLVFALMTASEAHPIKNMLYLNGLFTTESNISSFLCKSSLFRHARFPSDIPASTEDLRQLSAKLHVYYGLELEPSSEALCDSARLHNTNNPLFVRQVHPYARARVYDLRRYRTSNIWGPFIDDGSLRVDWEKIQSIMIILCYNLRMYTERRQPYSSLNSPASTSSTSTSPSTSTTPSTSSSTSSASTTLTSSNQLWDHPFQGLAPNSYTSHRLSGKLAPPLHPDLDALDPYGVSGTWMRIVCFLDYNDLYGFNFESGWIPLTQEREPIEILEAFRLIRLQLHVTNIEMPDPDGGYWEFEGAGTGNSAIGVREGREMLRKAERENAEWKKMPIVHFEGRSKSTYMAWDPNANSRIRGTVRMTPHNAIHWTSFSIFHGEERWRSEGIQIGGIRSARGVLGNWFDKDYDVHGPAGPTAFWKVSDDVLEEKVVVPSGMHGNPLWGVLSAYSVGGVGDGDVDVNGDANAGEVGGGGEEDG